MRFSLTEFLTKAYTIDLVDVEDQTGPKICQTLTKSTYLTVVNFE